MRKFRPLIISLALAAFILPLCGAAFGFSGAGAADNIVLAADETRPVVSFERMEFSSGGVLEVLTIEFTDGLKTAIDDRVGGDDGFGTFLNALYTFSTEYAKLFYPSGLAVRSNESDASKKLYCSYTYFNTYDDYLDYYGGGEGRQMVRVEKLFNTEFTWTEPTYFTPPVDDKGKAIDTYSRLSALAQNNTVEAFRGASRRCAIKTGMLLYGSDIVFSGGKKINFSGLYKQFPGLFSGDGPFPANAEDLSSVLSGFDLIYTQGYPTNRYRSDADEIAGGYVGTVTIGKSDISPMEVIYFHSWSIDAEDADGAGLFKSPLWQYSQPKVGAWYITGALIAVIFVAIASLAVMLKKSKSDISAIKNKSEF